LNIEVGNTVYLEKNQIKNHTSDCFIQIARKIFFDNSY